MRKIKVAMVLNDLSINGISKVVNNYCNHINLDKFDIDILAGEPVNDVYNENYKFLGINIKVLPSRKKSTKNYYKVLFKMFKAGKYDIVHIHGNSATIAPELLLAKLSGIKARIAHSHNTTCSHMKAHKILKPMFNLLCTDRFACGELAGKWLFDDKPFHVINNGFITERFIFNNDSRNEIRKKLKIEENDLLIGHIGRFNEQKNHPYLIQVFEKVVEKNPDTYLLLVGNGPDFEKINSIINQHKFKENIIVYGESNEAEKLYAAMDVMVFPSKFEGLPVTLIEAQISGLPCVISDKITHEMDFGDIKWHSIEAEPESWCQDILSSKISQQQREKKYVDCKNMIDKYNIKCNSEHLAELYYKISNKR